MPTIEIISINSPKLNINQNEFEIAIIEEHKIESHRGLFNNFIKQFHGTIFHLGSPDFKENKKEWFFAGDIIDWDFEYQDHFKFKNNYLPEIKQLIEIALKMSPTNEVIFLTDIQAKKGTRGKFRRFQGIVEFWEKYEKEGLKWNTAYLINLKKLLDKKRS